ncbi:MAG: helix-turn-helix domain-containing protein [Ruminococcus flavefaciens]|nr:helix-turn-helix domain-containing protein [Ruminococcus flavefaciens]
MSVRIDRAKFAAAQVRANLSGKMLAEKSGVSRVTVTSVRNGKSCSETTAQKLAEDLGVKVADIAEKVR